MNSKEKEKRNVYAEKVKKTEAGFNARPESVLAALDENAGSIVRR
jgi:hypothetical protein